MQSLEVFQSLWSMEQRQPDVRELTLAEVFERVAGAGFQGIALDTGTLNPALYTEAEQLLARHQLDCIVTAFPESLADMHQVLDVCAQVDAKFACINAQVFPMTPREGADFVQRCLELGETRRTPVYFETHRLTLTTDLLFTLQLLELVPELELVCDLSHYVVARELPNPVDDYWQELMSRVIARGAAFQGRVATREQVQVPIHFTQHQYWYELFQQWWTEGFRSWRQRKEPDATLNFLCELGPAPYAITGADGLELSDRWEEALDLKACAESIWNAGAAAQALT